MGEEIIGAVAGEVLPSALQLVSSKLRELANKNTAALLELMAVEERSFRARRDQETERKLRELEDKVEDVEQFRTQVVAMVDHPRFLLLQSNLEYEAVRETLEDRRQLLACAAAALAADPTLTIVEKARIERTLRLLDVVDVRTLRDVYLLDNSDFCPRPTDTSDPAKQKERDLGRRRRKLTDLRKVSQGVLLGAGCLEFNWAVWGNPLVSVSELGRLIVRVAEAYFDGAPAPSSLELAGDDRRVSG